MQSASIPLPINTGFPRTASYWHTLGVITSHYEACAFFNIPWATLILLRSSLGKWSTLKSLAFFLLCSSRVQDSYASPLSVFCLGSGKFRVRFASLALAWFSAFMNSGITLGLFSSTGLEGVWIINSLGSNSWGLTRKNKNKTQQWQSLPSNLLPGSHGIDQP